MTPLQQKINRAKTLLISSSPFFGLVSINTKMYAHGGIKTCGLKDGVIYYSPKFFNSIKINEIVFAIEHELYHKILKHSERLGDKDFKLWNIACDLAIHSSMISHKRHVDIILSKKYYYNPRFDNKQAEEVYWIIKSDSYIRNKVINECHGFDEHDKNIDQKKLGPSDDIGIRSAFKIAGHCGETHLKSLLDEHVKVTGKKYDLSNILRAYFEQSFKKHDYDWMYPDRRFNGSGFMIPSIQNVSAKESMSRCVFAIDTSGSVGRHEHICCVDAIANLCEDYNAELNLIFCDDLIQKHMIVSGNIDSLEIPYGGGTDFIPVFEYVEEQELNPNLLIYFTDLCVTSGEVPEKAPGYDVVWLKSIHGLRHHIPHFGAIHNFEF